MIDVSQAGFSDSKYDDLRRLSRCAVLDEPLEPKLHSVQERISSLLTHTLGRRCFYGVDRGI